MKMMKANLRPGLKLKEKFNNSTMVKLNPELIAEFMSALPILKQENLQMFQNYILYPFICNIKSAGNERKNDVLIPVIDTITSVLQQIQIETFDVAIKTEIALLSLVFDRAREGMIAKVPEEMKLSVMRCLTALMLGVAPEVKLQMLKSQMPVLAQAVFVSVHIAKLERMKTLRLAALECLRAHTMSHPSCTDDKMQVKYKELDEPTADYLSTILPGSLAALQDVAMSTNNPGHAVIVLALETIHRILCITMHNRRLKKKRDISVQDFTAMIAKSSVARTDDKPPSYKDLSIRCPEWYKVAGEKLFVITRSLAPLVCHEHYLVRRELAVLCARIVDECCDTLPTSVPLAVDIMLSLSKDGYKEVSQLCVRRVHKFFNKASAERRAVALDGMCEHFFLTLTNLPRIFNNIDSGRKLAALNQMHGYLEVLSDRCRPQRLTVAISAAGRCHSLCDTLLAAAAVQHELTLLNKRTVRDITSAPVSYRPWLQLRHLDSKECQKALEGIIQLLAAAECAELLLDRLLELFQQRRDCELVYIMNCLGSAPDAPTSLAKRIIDTYIEEDIWNLPLDIVSSERALTADETLDPDVYNPRAWIKDSTPGLYEGAIEVRYTDISLQCARDRSQGSDTCRNVAQSQRNVAMSCLLTEGVGSMAKRLKEEFQPFLLKTLCLVLERVGSKYEVVSQSGSKALSDMAEACSLRSAADLIAYNADYCTSQISIRLKKAWNVQSALRILTVVMTYSDTSILEYLYAIVEDVLVQSCDKYHQKDLFAYLQVFECFVSCIHKWFPVQNTDNTSHEDTCDDYLKDFTDFVQNSERVERLLNEEVDEDFGKSAEEMYKEDLAKREEDDLVYEDAVSQETPPLPKHVSVTLTILKRTINFIPLKERDECTLAMHIMALGLPILEQHENELLPLIHQTWDPLVTKFKCQEPLIMNKALELLVVMADLSKDFIRSRVLKDVFPQLLKFLSAAAADSFLQDSGSSYRLSRAYALQTHALAVLPRLVVRLDVGDASVEAAMTSVDHYLTKKQPKQLQELAVNFYKEILKYNYGLTWYHLRAVCDNSEVLEPPASRVDLQPVVGTPYCARNKDYNANIRLIFDLPSDA